MQAACTSYLGRWAPGRTPHQLRPIAQRPAPGTDPAQPQGWRTDFGAHYQLSGETLGSGSSSTVAVALGSDGVRVAVKIMPKQAERQERPRARGRRSLTSNAAMARAQVEADIWSRLQVGRSAGSEPFVKLLEQFEDETQLYLVQELCHGGTLQQLISARALNDQELCTVFAGIAEALHACHRRSVYHGDVKPSNFLFVDVQPSHHHHAQSGHPKSSLRVKMADFGCCVAEADSTMLRSTTGTLIYKSPESFSDGYCRKADLWSAGVTLYQMVTGHFPFWPNLASIPDDHASIKRAILSGKLIFDDAEWLHRPPQLQALVRNLLQYNPANRMSAAELVEHPFLASAAAC